MTSPSSEPAPPHPSDALLAAVAGMRAVRTRRPWQAVLAVGLVALACLSFQLGLAVVRGGLGPWSYPWAMKVTLVWLSLFALLLTAAMLPPRRQVLPDDRRAGLAALGGMAVLMALPFLFHALPSGAAAEDERWARWRVCLQACAFVSLPTVLAGAVALRGLVPGRAWRVGAAIGAAAGAVAGLAVRLGCPVTTAVSLWPVHTAAVVSSTLLGAALLPAFSGSIRSRPRHR